MSLFKRETNEGDFLQVKPRNHLADSPEKSTPESKEKLDSLERNKRNDFLDSLKVPDTSSKNKLNRPEKSGSISGASAEGDPTKGQRQLEKGKETQMER